MFRTNELLKELKDESINYIVCSGSSVDVPFVEKLIYVVTMGIDVYPPLSSQMRGVLVRNSMFLSSSHNELEHMSYFVQVDRVNYTTGKKVIKILWQSVRRAESKAVVVFCDMDYFSNDCKELVENIIGENKLDIAPDFNVDIRGKCKEICHNGLIMKLAFTSDMANT